MGSEAKTLGERIRTLRKMRQMTVGALAAEVNISRSYLEKIENGSRTPPNALIIRLAKALDVGPERLHGQPYFNHAESEERVQAIIPPLRRIMLTYDSPDDLQVEPRPLQVLAVETEHVSRMRRDGAYAPMGPLLPPLLTELTHVALGSSGREREKAFGLLARAYRAANSLAHKLGYHDLSVTAIERVRWAADRSADPLMQITADYLKAGAMIRVGTFSSARQLLERLAEQVERLAPEGSMTEQQLAVQGAVLLKLAILEARDGHPERAAQYLHEAETAAAFGGNRDTDFYEMSFGPTNTRIHKVAVLIDSGDAEQALARIREWGEQQGREEWELPGGFPAERTSHHYIDVAAAKLTVGDRRGSFASLQIARQISPVHTRFHPTTRHTVAALARLERHSSETVAGYARWAGAI